MPNNHPNDVLDQIKATTAAPGFAAATTNGAKPKAATTNATTAGPLAEATTKATAATADKRPAGFDAKGNYTPQDDDVAAQVAKVVDKGGPLMKQAQGLGMAMANKRGLANSSIAVGASQNEVLKVATPIGTANAGQIHQKNVTFMTEKAAGERHAADIVSREKISAAQIASAEKIAKMQEAGLAARTAQQIAANRELQAMADQSALTRQMAADFAALERQKAELASRADLSAAEIAAQTERLNAELASRERLGLAELAQNAKNNAVGAAAQLSSSYMTALSNSMQNDKLPAAARAQFEAALKAATQSSMQIVEQVTGQPMNWGTPTAQPGTASTPIGNNGVQTWWG